MLFPFLGENLGLTVASLANMKFPSNTGFDS